MQAAAQRRGQEPARRPSAGAAEDGLGDPLAASAAALEGLGPPSVREVAQDGVGGPGKPLPFRDAIARAFGPGHDLSGVTAHAGPEAADAAGALGARAYATGTDVAFGGAPDLHTAAHEAAHVVQARDGVQLKALGGGGDGFERHADAVADRVVAGESAADLLASGPARAEPGAVQGKGIGELRDDLINGSVNRTSNANYNTILQELERLATVERLAMTAGELQPLLLDVINLRQTIAGAVSNHGLSKKNATRVARNQALDDLDEALGEKEVELQAKIDADAVTPATQHQVQGGPKAGFEMEYSDVYVFDAAALNANQKRMVNSGQAQTQPFWAGVQQASGLAKRSVIFTSGGGTWEGQTDSTTTCANLELVTKPLTAEEWEGDAAATDAQQLAEFAEALDGAPRRQALLPRQLHGGVSLNLAGARLYKGDMHAYAQTQMTAAVDQGPGVKAPEWWIPGLRTSALPNLKSVVRGLTMKSMGLQNNPKSSVFLKDQKNVLIKSPMSQLLGQPTVDPEQEAVEDFVLGLADLLKVDPGANAVGQLVQMNNEHNARRPQFRLVGAEFTFRDYFEGLLRGEDLVTDWARTAFGGVEDIGVGQIADPSLPDDWAVEEHREMGGVGTRNYLQAARQWGRTGRVPGT